MAYKVLVNRESKEFNPLLNLIEHVRKTYGTATVQEIKEIIEKEYNIKIGDYFYFNKKGTHPVEFESKSSFVWFLLRWA